jgi:hypothetical protein
VNIPPGRRLRHQAAAALLALAAATGAAVALSAPAHAQDLSGLSMLTVDPTCSAYGSSEQYCTETFTQSGYVNGFQLAYVPGTPITVTATGAAGGKAGDGTAGGEGGRVSTSFTFPASWGGDASLAFTVGGNGGNGGTAGSLQTVSSGGSGGGGGGASGGGGVGPRSDGGGGGGGATWVTAVDNSDGSNATGQATTTLAVGPGGGGGATYPSDGDPVLASNGGNAGAPGGGLCGGNPGTATAAGVGASPAAGKPYEQYCAGGYVGDYCCDSNGANGSGPNGGAGATPDSGGMGLATLATNGGGGGGGGYYGGAGGGAADGVTSNYDNGGTDGGGGGGGSNGLAVTPVSAAASVTLSWYASPSTTTTLNVGSGSAATNGGVMVSASVVLQNPDDTTADGSVQFYVNGQPHGSPVRLDLANALSGTALTRLWGLPAGTDSIIAGFIPAAGDSPLVAPSASAVGLVRVTAPAQTDYTFTKAPTSYDLDLEVNGTNGGVDIWQQAGSGAGTAANEVWAWEPTGNGDGTGWLVNRQNGQCLEINGTSGAIDTWSCVDGALNELWAMVPNTPNPANGELDGGTALLNEQVWEYIGLSQSNATFSNGDALTLWPGISNFTSWTATQVS